MTVNDFTAVYKKDPFTVQFDLETLRNGKYLVEGEVSSENWHKACERIDVPAVGQCYARLVIDKSSYKIDFQGEIDVEMERDCSRSGEAFMFSEKLTFTETAFLKARTKEEEEDLFESSILDVGHYLTEQIILEMNPIPVSPLYISREIGGFDVVDNLDDEENDKKNPFSVLKSLKSDA